MLQVVVVGAGAAGTMAAIWAASAGARTVLLERTADGGRKILISGGGRCNILPARLDEARFVTDSSKPLLRRIVRSWPLREQIAYFERDAGIPLVEQVETGKLFPASQSARDVRDRLLRLAARHGVNVRTNAHVFSVAPSPSGWQVQLKDDRIDCDVVVLATGGLSVPKTGSDGAGLRIAAALGHEINPTYPALTPLTSAAAPFGRLAGISLPVTIAARAHGRSASAFGGFLFTHGGYSGPAVLDVSHVAVRSRLETNGDARMTVRWTPLGDAEWERELRARGTRTVTSAVAAHLPERLAAALVEYAGLAQTQVLAELARADRLRLIETLVRGVLPWDGDEGYKKAEVTGGGVALAEIDPATMESRRHAGLFLCGEMLDAFGPIGGYNFLWAWATGRAAGLGAARRAGAIR